MLVGYKHVLIIPLTKRVVEYLILENWKYLGICFNIPAGIDSQGYLRHPP